MQKISIEALARQQLHAAIDAGGRRASDTVFGGHEKSLRQTVIAILQGESLNEHENHDDATIYMIQGRIRLCSGDASWEARTGALLIVPDGRNSIEVLEDSVLLLSVAKRPYPRGQLAPDQGCRGDQALDS